MTSASFNLRLLVCDKLPVCSRKCSESAILSVSVRKCAELNTDLQSQASQETANRKNDDFQLFGAGVPDELVKIEFSVLRIIALAPEDPVNKDRTCLHRYHTDILGEWIFHAIL